MFASVKVSDHYFTDDALIIVETMDILMVALQALNEESGALGLWTSSVKTKIQAFTYNLDTAILSVPVCGEDVEVTERFTYLGSDIHVSACCKPEVLIIWGLGSHWIMGVALSVPMQAESLSL